MLELDFDLAVGDEIHGVRWLAPPGYDASTVYLLGSQHLDDLADLSRAQFAEQRDPGHEAPGDHEVAAMHFVGEGCRNDADRQRDHKKTREDRQTCDNTSDWRDRYSIAVADGSKGDDRPP